MQSPDPKDCHRLSALVIPLSLRLMVLCH